MSKIIAGPQLAHVNGIDLAYQVFGTGSPLILLHGGFGSVEMFGSAASSGSISSHMGARPLTSDPCASKRWATTSLP